MKKYRYKRVFDLLVFITLLPLFLVAVPIFLTASLLIFIYDRHSPIYKAPRIGKGFKTIIIYKIRTMIPNADKSGVDSTSLADNRLLPFASLIRRFKFDEFAQAWNVLKGDISFVGPRPNVKRETDLYSKQEIRLLSVQPGITDFSSIVFSDLGEILSKYEDPDLAYNQLVRPWKSRLGLFYIDHGSPLVDLALIALTAINSFNRPQALMLLSYLLKSLGASEELITVSSRTQKLIPKPPPGSCKVVTSRVITPSR